MHIWRVRHEIWIVLEGLEVQVGACCQIIRAAALLHNFLVDSRDGTDDFFYFKNLSHADITQSKKDCQDEDDETVHPLVTDNNAKKPPGRKLKDDIERKNKGEKVRMNITTNLAEEGLGRPFTNRMKVNPVGNIYFE